MPVLYRPIESSTRHTQHSNDRARMQVHSKCDLPHTKVSPGQQRAHLKSAYLDILGESFGMTGVNAARADRFLSEAKHNMRSVSRDQIVKQLMSYCCPERLVRELLYDINNQSSDAERLISPKCTCLLITHS